jgi:hypothetical protein
VHLLDNKVLDVIDARCNREVENIFHYITLQVTQTLNTKHPEHPIPWKRDLFQVYYCKYPA